MELFYFCGTQASWDQMPSIPSLSQETELFFPLAFRLIKDSVHHLQTLRQAGADEHDAWNQTTVIHIQATKVSCQSARAERACSVSPASCQAEKTCHYASALLSGCPHFTFKALAPGILIKGLNSKAVLLDWQLLEKKVMRRCYWICFRLFKYFLPQRKAGQVSP